MIAYAPGRPCHADLMSSDVARSSFFYAAVLGWSFEERGPVLIAKVGQRTAAAVVPSSDRTGTGWTMYFASDDAQATSSAVEAAGGIVIQRVGDVGEYGRMLLVEDPAGAHFGVWEAGTMPGSARYAEPGFLTWTDLRSQDPAAAKAFYAAALGHEHTPMSDDMTDYETFSRDGSEPLGGVGGMMGDEQASSHWLPYFGVPDAEAAVTIAGASGGAVNGEPFPTPFGTMAPLADPFGNPFWIVQLPA